MPLLSLLDIVNRVQDELALPRTAAVAASIDPQVRQLYALVNAGGRAIMTKYTWGGLRTLRTFPTVAAQSDYTVPADFDRLVPQTQWDRVNMRKLGVDTPQLMRARLEAGVVQSPFNRTIQQIGRTAIRVFPTPTAAGQTLVYEYVSTNWARAAGGIPQPEFQADSDTSVFVPDLHVRDLKWRFLSAKGLPAEAAKLEFDDKLKEAIAAETGMPTLTMGGDDEDDGLLGIDNVPDSGYGA